MAASTDLAALEALFERWWRLWREERYDLLPSCITDDYTTHTTAGTQHYSPDTRMQRMVEPFQASRAHYTFYVHDRTIAGDRVWLRGTHTWTDPQTGEQLSEAALALYRIAEGKLAETWWATQPRGSVWPEFVPRQA